MTPTDKLCDVKVLADLTLDLPVNLGDPICEFQSRQAAKVMHYCTVLGLVVLPSSRSCLFRDILLTVTFYKPL